MNNFVEVFTAASHHNVLALVAQIAVLLFTARLFGEVAQRLGQPAVIGELLAGITLGPSCLGNIFPFIVGYIIPAKPVQGYLLESIGLIGAMFLLLITGLETDLNLIRRHARTAIGVSLGGILITFSSGFVLGLSLPDNLVASPEGRLIFSLFMATTLAISAIPVLAKILMDLKLMRWNVGQTMIASGMLDDTIGWIMLSVVAGLASGKIVSALTIFSAVGKVFLFLLFSFTLGQWIVKKSIDFVQDHGISQDRLLTLVVVLTFTWGSLTQSLHLEPILGAFIMGIILGRMPRLPQSVHQKLQSIALGIFAPIFFAVAGLKVNVLNLCTPPLLRVALLVIIVASAGKIVGTYLGARIVGGKDRWTSLCFGAGLNARGAMEIIIATIGLSLGILTQEMFSIIVLMAMATSIMAPFMLRWVISHVKPAEEETKRLQQEKLEETSSIGRIHRVLVPVRSRESFHQSNVTQVIKSRLLQNIGKSTPLSITLLSVDKNVYRNKNTAYLNDLTALFPKHEVVKKAVDSLDVINTILDEAQKDYDLLVLGASEKDADSNHLFSKIIDSVINLSPCLTAVVHADKLVADWAPKNILVPTNGSFAAKRAVEFSFLIPSSEKETVTIFNVIEKNIWRYDAKDEIFQRQLKVAEHMVEDLKELAEAKGIHAMAEVQSGPEPETIILNAAKKKNIDLIILGTDVRPASNRLFLGPRVEYIIKNAPCPVIILNSP